MIYKLYVNSFAKLMRPWWICSHRTIRDWRRQIFLSSFAQNGAVGCNDYGKPVWFLPENWKTLVLCAAFGDFWGRDGSGIQVGEEMESRPLRWRCLPGQHFLPTRCQPGTVYGRPGFLLGILWHSAFPHSLLLQTSIFWTFQCPVTCLCALPLSHPSLQRVRRRGWLPCIRCLLLFGRNVKVYFSSQEMVSVVFLCSLLSAAKVWHVSGTV